MPNDDECVSVALVIRRAKRMRRIILLSVACPALPHFPTLSHKRHDLKLLNTKRVFRFSLQLLSETFLILRRTERDVIKTVYRSACKVPLLLLLLLGCDVTGILLGRFSKNILKFQI